MKTLSPRTPPRVARGKLESKKTMKLQNLIHMLIGIVCVGLLPTTQAVSPAPDGGYPGGNTAEGFKALFGLSTKTAVSTQRLVSILLLPM
jgi:hypothetical protein